MNQQDRNEILEPHTWGSELVIDDSPEMLSITVDTMFDHEELKDDLINIVLESDECRELVKSILTFGKTGKDLDDLRYRASLTIREAIELVNRGSY